MYILTRTFSFYRLLMEKEVPEERLFVSTIVMSVEEKNTEVKKAMQMQIKTL